jgi:hypothetical protein
MLTYSFLDDLDEDPHFIEELYDGTVRALTENEILGRLERMRRRLNGRCMGLLEISKADTVDLFFKYRVGFLHRTVQEFLSQEEMQEELKIRARNFNESRSLCLAFLAQVKFVPTRDEHFRSSLSSVCGLVDELSYSAFRAEYQDSNPQVRVVEALYDLLDRHREIPFSHPQETIENTGRISWMTYHGPPNIEVRYGVERVRIETSLIHHAAYSGLFGFVSQKASMSPSLLNPSNDLVYLCLRLWG